MTRPTNRLRVTLIVLLLLIAALGSLWVLQVLQRESEGAPAALRKGESDYTVDRSGALQHFRRQADALPCRRHIRNSKAGHLQPQ